ncbi:MAG: NAD-dependent epimerase/dehydratase family protein [Pseudomonadota bacterium]|nr:NAD-dependent epimerase/dehydratase family protein [Pseudomonadota bacterium]
MQTILGSTGPIGTLLAKDLHNFTQDIRLVSRTPSKVNATDTLFKADLLNLNETKDAIEGSSIVYFTAGLPLDTQTWVQKWPILMNNVIEACIHHNAKLVYFDNTYMYPQSSLPLLESTPFKPNGPKGEVRGLVTQLLLDAMRTRHLEALICRAPEFYGPENTKSFTQSAIITPLLNSQTAKVLLSSTTKRTLIYTPDATRAMALLGNTPRAFGETWHLPCCETTPTYEEFIQMCSAIFNTESNFKIIQKWQINIGSIFSKQLKEIQELLPRYEHDSIFNSAKFKKAFPTFKTTNYEEGLKAIFKEHQDSKTNLKE